MPSATGNFRADLSAASRCPFDGDRFVIFSPSTSLQVRAPVINKSLHEYFIIGIACRPMTFGKATGNGAACYVTAHFGVIIGTLLGAFGPCRWPASRKLVPIRTWGKKKASDRTNDCSRPERGVVKKQVKKANASNHLGNEGIKESRQATSCIAWLIIAKSLTTFVWPKFLNTCFISGCGRLRSFLHWKIISCWLPTL